MNYKLEGLVNSISDKKIILIGENHGVHENATFVRQFVDTMRKKRSVAFVGFEYPESMLKLLYTAARDRNFSSIQFHRTTQTLLNDGRYSRSHLELLSKLIEWNIPIVFFDGDNEQWDLRDQSMYFKLRTALSTSRPGTSIIIAGNIHTSRDVLVLDERLYKPLGWYLRSLNGVQIRLIYHGGQYYNHGRKSFAYAPLPRKRLEPVSSTLFNFHLGKATPSL